MAKLTLGTGPLTRLATLGPLSRDAGEGLQDAPLQPFCTAGEGG
jgi:hypothetical protein